MYKDSLYRRKPFLILTCVIMLSDFITEFGDRYLRFPLYAYYQWYYDSLLRDRALHQEIEYRADSLVNRKFCNFVYSNNVNSDPVRDAFY